MDHIDCTTRERELGMTIFVTRMPGTGGRLRKRPEDFRVVEISEYPEEKVGGRYTIARVTATNWETNRLIRMLSKRLGISRTRIGFAGTKDKRAVTTQLMSFEAPIEEVKSLDLYQVSIDRTYPAARGINIGDLRGNSFVVRVSDCALRGDELREAVREVTTVLERMKGFPNFFGVQRFGSLRPVTHLVGRHIVKGRFEEAVMAYVANPTPYEAAESRQARERLERTLDFEWALENYPKKLTFERTVIGHLVRHPGDYVGALARLPVNLQMMFVHAYQSYMFNQLLSARVRECLPLNSPVIGDVVLPADVHGLPEHERHIPVTERNIDLVREQVREGRAFVSGVLYGSESELAEGKPGELETMIIEEQDVSREDFVVPALPHCSSTGSRRELLAPLWNFGVEVDHDCFTVSFSLGRGCYATSLLREYVKGDPMDY